MREKTADKDKQRQVAICHNKNGTTLTRTLSCPVLNMWLKILINEKSIGN